MTLVNTHRYRLGVPSVESGSVVSRADSLPSPPTTGLEAPPRGDSRDGWQHVVAVVAAAAGGAAWVSAIGSAVVGLRLANASLPVEPVVALMSAEHRFAIGASYLIAPLFVGLVGFLVDWLVIKHQIAGGPAGSETSSGEAAPPSNATMPTPTHLRWRNGCDARRWSAREQGAVATVVVGSVLGAFLLQPPVPWLFVSQSVVLLVVVLIVISIRSDLLADDHRINERLAVFVTVLVSAGTIALCYEQLFAEAEFHTAHIEMTDGRDTVEGGYVTTTETAVLIVTRDSDDCAVISAVRRDQIERLRVEATQVNVADDPKSCAGTTSWRDVAVEER